MSYQARIYLHGLAASAIGGASNAVTLLIIDPLKFNLADFDTARNLIVAMLVSALVSFFTYLKTHPLPDPEKDTDALAVAQGKVSAINLSMLGTGTGTGNGGPPT